jgi:hypothetical protein
LVNQGCISPLCDFLTAQDAKIVQVALNGLENILKVGDADAKAIDDVNRFAVLIEECYGKTNCQLLNGILMLESSFLISKDSSRTRYPSLTQYPYPYPWDWTQYPLGIQGIPEP